MGEFGDHFPSYPEVWNPFKAHAPRKSAISRTEEREFDRETKKLELLDSNIRTLYKDVKNCNESQNVMSKGALKLTEELHRCSQPINDPELSKYSEAWLHAAQTIDNLSLELNTNCNRTVADPMKRLSVMFPGVQTSMKRRDHQLQEYTKYQAKVGKYLERDRTGINVAKLDQHKKSRASAKDSYENHNRLLMEDMPKLYEGRIAYFQPSFQALIRSQVKYYTEAHNAYDTLLDATTANTEITPEQLTQRISQNMQQIKALSITVDD